MYSKPFIAEIQDHIQRLIDKHEAKKENLRQKLIDAGLNVKI